MHALCLFALPPAGFRQRDVRAHVAALQGLPLAAYGPGALSYDLRRLRLHGLIERVPKTHRYRVTTAGARAALFFVRLYARALRPTFALDGAPAATRAGATAYQRLDQALDLFLKEVKIAA